MTKRREEDHEQAWMKDFLGSVSEMCCFFLYGHVQRFTLEVRFKKCGADSKDNLMSSGVSECYTGYMGKSVLVNVEKEGEAHTAFISRLYPTSSSFRWGFTEM